MTKRRLAATALVLLLVIFIAWLLNKTDLTFFINPLNQVQPVVMKRPVRLPRITATAPAANFPTLPAILPEELRVHVEKTMTFVDRNINGDTNIGYSFVGDKRLSYWAVTYDNAIRAIAHIQTGNIAMAERTIDYFIDTPGIQQTGWIVKNGKRVRSDGWIVNIIDASIKRYGGRSVEHALHAGPNAYIGIAALHLYKATGKRKYLLFARNRWELLKSLQNTNPKDPNYGGIRMGPLPPLDNPFLQRVSFKKGNPFFYEMFNGEHAADFKALSDLLYKYDTGYKKRYADASALITIWDKRIYDRKKHLFYMGTTEKPYYDENIGVRVKAGIIPMYPLDTTALKISAYGVDGLETFEIDGAEKIRAALDKQFKVTVHFKNTQGEKITATGYDFVGPSDRKRLILYVEEGPNADIKVKRGVGRAPLLTDEWSSWVAFADLRLAADYQKKGDAERSLYYQNKYTENAIVEAQKTAQRLNKNELAYPYAHPMPRSLNKPVGFGWNTHHQPYAIIGSLTRTLGILRFDPLLPEGGVYALQTKIKPGSLGRSVGMVLPDGVLFTEAELFVIKAWEYTNKALAGVDEQALNWQKAIDTVDFMLKSNPDWMRIARNQNGKAKIAKERFPLLGRTNLDERKVFGIYRNYWALYHVGTAHYIKAVAHASLYQLALTGNDQEKAFQEKNKAFQAARDLMANYTYTQTYDLNGWFWQPANVIEQELEKRGIDTRALSGLRPNP